MANDHEDLALHVYTFFGRTDYLCQDEFKNLPEFVHSLDVVCDFLDWFAEQKSGIAATSR